MRKRKQKYSRSPRRKAGSSRARKASRTVRFRLTVENQAMIVTYRPGEADDPFRSANFEFTSPHKTMRRIAISETGYHCHFAPKEDIEAAGSPQSYARDFVLSFLNSGRKAANSDQLSLF